MANRNLTAEELKRANDFLADIAREQGFEAVGRLIAVATPHASPEIYSPTPKSKKLSAVPAPKKPETWN